MHCYRSISVKPLPPTPSLSPCSCVFTLTTAQRQRLSKLQITTAESPSVCTVDGKDPTATIWKEKRISTRFVFNNPPGIIDHSFQCVCGTLLCIHRICVSTNPQSLHFLMSILWSGLIVPRMLTLLCSICQLFTMNCEPLTPHHVYIKAQRETQCLAIFNYKFIFLLKLNPSLRKAAWVGIAGCYGDGLSAHCKGEKDKKEINWFGAIEVVCLLNDNHIS